MLLNQELYNHIENYIDENYIVFDKKSYCFVLEDRLNDSNFIKEYIFDDIKATGAELSALLQELTEVFAVNLESGISIAREYESIYENKARIENTRDAIDKIKTTIEEEDLEFSSANVSKIRQQLDFQESSLLSIDTKALTDNDKTTLNEVISKLKAVRFELDNIFKNFFEDIDYETQITRAFKTNNLWSTNYGGYNYNPYLSIPSVEDEATVDFDILTNCEYLKNTKNYFSPLVHGDKLFVSTDGVSITVIDSANNQKKIELNDEIIFSGTIMYLKMDRFLIVPCKKAIQIIDIINGLKLLTPINYGGFGDDYEVKSIASFNNYCYINISDYTNNTSVIWRLMYYNKFIPKRRIISKRILSNLSLVYDSKSAKMKLYYIDYEGYLVNLDCNSLDEVAKYSLKALPIDRYYRKGNSITRFTYPIMSYDDRIYYLSILKDLSLNLCIVDTSKDDLETIIKLPRYQIQSKETGDIVPSFSNIVINDEKAAILGPFYKKLATFKYIYKDIKLQEETDSSFDKPYGKNTFIIMNDDKPIRITDKFNLENKHMAKIACIWGKKIVVLVDNPQANGYTLYTEIKR